MVFSAIRRPWIGMGQDDGANGELDGERLHGREGGVGKRRRGRGGGSVGEEAVAWEWACV